MTFLICFLIFRQLLKKKLAEATNAASLKAQNKPDVFDALIALHHEKKRTSEEKPPGSTIDALTKLPNRRHLFDFIHYISSLKQESFNKYALFIVNLDFFRTVNSHLGHDAGDQILVECAQRISSAFPENSFIARMDGDEFAVLLPISKPEDLEAEANKILDSIKKPVVISGQQIFISVSIGIAVLHEDAKTPEELIRHAAAAVSNVKNSRRSSYMVYSPDMVESSRYKFSLVSELHQAIERNEFVLHYQPKIDGKTSQIVGIEALIRWNHPLRGLLYPIDFIPIAEETGIIKYIDEWVLYNACLQLKKWTQEGIRHLRLAVNLSAWQFKDQHLVDIVSKVLSETGIDPSSLELEITETAAMENMNFTQNILTRLISMGVAISIDDFGTGYSSLNYLKHFPISFLKIDRSFVADILSDKNTYSIVRAIIEVAHALQLKVIAEGVENQEQLDMLKELGCDEVQGYHISRPLPVDDIQSRIKGTC
jgi:diguanylate cyclase (GGDEF)-like protein